MRLVALDERLLRVARTRGHGQAAERAVAAYSRLGEHGGVWLALGSLGYCLDRSRRSGWSAATAAVAASYALNTAVKLLVRRRRPLLPGLPALATAPTRLSFPSAHAATSFAGAAAYARLGVPRGPLYVLAVSLAASRTYLGLHYPSDLLGGALLGTAVARVVGPTRRAGGLVASAEEAPA